MVRVPERRRAIMQFATTSAHAEATLHEAYGIPRKIILLLSPSPLKETVREEANHTPRRYCQRNGNPLSIMIIRFSPPSINRFYSKDRTNSVRAIIVAALHKTTLQCQGRASLENALRLRAREGEFSGGARIGNN